MTERYLDDFTQIFVGNLVVRCKSPALPVG